MEKDKIMIQALTFLIQKERAEFKETNDYDSKNKELYRKLFSFCIDFFVKEGIDQQEISGFLAKKMKENLFSNEEIETISRHIKISYS